MLKLKFLSSVIIYLILNFGVVQAQNLILNNSFENLSSCPDAQGQIDKAEGWECPTQGTPDLYNSCSTVNNNARGVPLNNVGYQGEMANENGYVGLYTYSGNIFTAPNLREYIQTQLISILNPCSVYEVIFYVSLADSFKYAINSIGAYIGDSAIHRNDEFCFSYYEPQINNPKPRMLDDKVNWSKIEGKFVSSGGEQYITIGNFDLDNEIDTLATEVFNPGRPFSYYYIDNVSLTLFADATLNAFAGNDTMVEPGDSIFIGQEIKGLNCTWRKLDGTFITDSTSGIYVLPTEQTTYVVEQNLCGTITYDTVVVSVGFVGLDENPVSSLEGGLRRVTISPNPNTGKFYLKSLNKNDIQIFDLQGRLVKFTLIEIDSNTKEIEIDAENGMYNILIIHPNSIENVKIQVLK